MIFDKSKTIGVTAPFLCISCICVKKQTADYYLILHKRMMLAL